MNEETLTIPLNGSLDSTLDWRRQFELAQACVEDGTKILWEMDLGLFNRLQYSLSNESQYLSLKLSLEHFRDTLWASFKGVTKGICLYHGSVDLTPDYIWDDEEKSDLKFWLKGVDQTPHLIRRYCAQATAEYLDLLASYLPFDCQAYVQFATNAISDPLQKAQLSSKELYPHIELIIDGKPPSTSTVAICLPSIHEIRPEQYSEFTDIFMSLEDYRVIPEPLLTTEWHGLDTLYVSKKALTTQGERMAQGFIAAGGTVLYL